MKHFGALRMKACVTNNYWDLLQNHSWSWFVHRKQTGLSDASSREPGATMYYSQADVSRCDAVVLHSIAYHNYNVEYGWPVMFTCHRVTQ